MLNCGHEGVSGEQGVEALPPSGLGTEGLNPPPPSPLSSPPTLGRVLGPSPEGILCRQVGGGGGPGDSWAGGLSSQLQSPVSSAPPPRPPDVHSPRRKPEARSTWAVRRGPCTGPASLALTCSLPPCTWAGGEDSEPGDPGPRS